MNNKDQIVPIRLTQDEKHFLMEVAEKKGIGLSTLIRVVLREYIAEVQEKRKEED